MNSLQSYINIRKKSGLKVWSKLKTVSVKSCLLWNAWELKIGEMARGKSSEEHAIAEQNYNVSFSVKQWGIKDCISKHKSAFAQLVEGGKWQQKSSISEFPLHLGKEMGIIIILTASSHHFIGRCVCFAAFWSCADMICHCVMVKPGLSVPQTQWSMTGVQSWQAFVVNPQNGWFCQVLG